MNDRCRLWMEVSWGFLGFVFGYWFSSLLDNSVYK